MASLLPQLYFDSGAGLTPSDGSLLFFKVVGSETPKDVYSDATASTPLTNPVVSDSKGVFPAIYIVGDYDWELQDKNLVQQNTGSVSEVALASEVDDEIARVEGEIDRALLSFDTVADLRTATTTDTNIFLKGYYAIGDGGHGALYLDSADISTADNAGTVFVTANSKRYKRHIEDSVIHAGYFGAVNGALDNTKNIAAMFRTFEGVDNIVYDFGSALYGIDSTASTLSFTLDGITIPASGLKTYTSLAGTDFSLAVFDDFDRPFIYDQKYVTVKGGGARLLMVPTWQGSTGVDFAIITMIKTDYLTVKGMVLDGNRDNISTPTTNRDNNHNLRLYTDNTNVRIHDNLFKSSGDDNTGSSDMAGDGIFSNTDGNDYVSIYDNTFEDSGRWDITIEKGKGTSIIQWVVTDNDFVHKASSTATEIGAIDYETPANLIDFKIANNTFKGNNCGISVSGFVTGVLTVNVERMSITNNTWTNISGSGLTSYILSTGAGVEGVSTYRVFKELTIKGNILRRADSNRSAFLLNSARFEDLVFEDNTITAVIKNNNNKAIEMNSATLSGTLSISDNTFVRWGQPINMGTLGYDASLANFDATIANNIFIDCHFAWVIATVNGAGQYSGSDMQFCGNVGRNFSTSTGGTIGNNDFNSVWVQDRHLLDTQITSASNNVEWQDGNRLRTYADDAAAGAGGLVAGETYKTATGEMRVKV